MWIRWSGKLVTLAGKQDPYRVCRSVSCVPILIALYLRHPSPSTITSSSPWEMKVYGVLLSHLIVLFVFKLVFCGRHSCLTVRSEVSGGNGRDAWWWCDMRPLLVLFTVFVCYCVLLVFIFFYCFDHVQLVRRGRIMGQSLFIYYYYIWVSFCYICVYCMFSFNFFYRFDHIQFTRRGGVMGTR